MISHTPQTASTHQRQASDTQLHATYLQDYIRQYQQQQQPQSTNSFEYPQTFDPAASSNVNDFGSHLDDWLCGKPMQSDTWSSAGQPTPRMGRFSHHRESSLSSLGSTGPASPYNHNTSNPHIAISDATSEALSDIHAQEASAAGSGLSYYQPSKSLGHSYGYQNLDQAMPEMAYPVTIPGPNSKPRSDHSMLPTPDTINRSHPASVASSVTSDSPATPTTSTAVADNDRRRRAAAVGYNHNVPKLDRTMTDVYGDELYNPNFVITSTSAAQEALTLSPSRNINDVFSQRLNAANSHHLSAAHSPGAVMPRDKSPFLNGSPHAPPPLNDMSHGAPLNSAQRLREQNKAKQDAQLYQQQMAKATEPETPKTISPKDAILEFNEADGDVNFPLFPQDSTNFGMDQLAKSMMPQVSTSSMGQSVMNQQATGTGTQFPPYLAPSSQMSAGLQVPQQYPFIARPQPQAVHDSPPRLTSAGSSSAGSRSSTPVSHARPMGMTADGGTYTCTYHGCTLRFETPALLQKHKREGHRATLLGTERLPEVGMTTNLLNSQAGPHRCDRINPSTGKSCNTVFSRPYDLTRHEDTIHNGRKQKVRCNLCTEEKSFSRADALTRHYRVCHPDMELPGKHRRRAMM